MAWPESEFDEDEWDDEDEDEDDEWDDEDDEEWLNDQGD